jgi:hypothetical protein
MMEVIHDYVNPYSIANNILQDACNHEKYQLVGKAEENIEYVYAVCDALVAKGHFCELLFTHHDVIHQVQEIVIKEELTRWENKKEPTLKRGQARTDVHLNNALGLEDGPKMKFLIGILFATSTSKIQSPFLEDVIQADAVDMSFGKYTLFLAYARSANGKMVGLGFAILFGNEDKKNWSIFWVFLMKMHPIIMQMKMIITDQDK